MTDLFEQRIELGKALCEAVGINPDNCTDLTLQLKQSGETEVIARLIPNDLGKFIEVVQRLELFPKLVEERAKALDQGIQEISAVVDAAVRRVVVPNGS